MHRAHTAFNLVISPIAQRNFATCLLKDGNSKVVKFRSNCAFLLESVLSFFRYGKILQSWLQSVLTAQPQLNSLLLAHPLLMWRKCTTHGYVIQLQYIR